MTTYEYNSGPAAGNVYMNIGAIQYTMTLDWSYDAIYFHNSYGKKWYTMGTGEKTTKFEWDDMAYDDKIKFFDMILFVKQKVRADYDRVKADEMIQSHLMGVFDGDDNTV